MNKKTIIIGSILTIVLMGAVLWLVFSPSNKEAPETPPALYSLDFIELNGVIGSRLTIGNNDYELTPEAFDKFGLATYNSPKDLMWVECPEGYTLKNPVSSSSNKITSDSVLNAVNIELNIGKQNKLQITCEK